MDREEALRAISEDQLDYIQKPVAVSFDTAGRMPVSFTVSGKKHLIVNVLERFRTCSEQPVNAFLVRTAANHVFFLYFQIYSFISPRPMLGGFWVLSFRILNDYELMALYRRERKMIVNMALKRIADFHGHVCPDLVLGSKLCDYIQKLLPSNKPDNGIAAIISENCTSALDAIQILLGATLGNQRLKVMDYGKHNYTVIPKSASTSFRLILNIQIFEDENEYNRLASKMLDNTILMDEVVQLQILLDERVKHLLKQPPESLYRIESTEKKQQLPEVPSVYLTCCRCSEQVLHSHAVHYKSATYCSRCFQILKAGYPSYCLQ